MLLSCGKWRKVSFANSTILFALRSKFLNIVDFNPNGIFCIRLSLRSMLFNLGILTNKFSFKRLIRFDDASNIVTAEVSFGNSEKALYDKFNVFNSMFSWNVYGWTFSRLLADRSNVWSFTSPSNVLAVNVSSLFPFKYRKPSCLFFANILSGSIRIALRVNRA